MPPAAGFLLIAHRGGVVGPGAPENSLAAIRGAAEHGYTAVELDVRASKDDQPVLFHGDWSRTLRLSCGVDKAVHELTLAELRRIRYVATDEPVVGLDEALGLCERLRLGVMLDWKVESTSDELLGRVAGMLADARLPGPNTTISNDPRVREALGKHLMRRVTRELPGQFWFGHADQITDDEVRAHREAGRLVIPSINTFHYPPHAVRELGGRDVARLAAAGVDGFQIDHDFYHFVPRSPAGNTAGRD
jgi:glycerophosphoryl diester phosphodiesterase